MPPTADPNLSRPLCEGRYVLRSELGEGSTATVYDAFDEQKKIECAVKILSPAFALHRDARARFEREAATMARLHHPNIVEVYDYGLDGERFYIVMEKVRGETLMEKVDREGPVRPRLAASLMQRTLLALHHAHAQGIIHRDVKPHNILIGPLSVPKVTDFGLARAMHFDQALTIPGAVMGTWAYMAPEQRYDSGNVDIRTDIYAAGATLFTILTGKEGLELLKPNLARDPMAGLPKNLVDVIRRSTRFQPEERFQTAEEMAAELAIAHAALPSVQPDDEATLLQPQQEQPIPVAFREFGHLEQVREELTGARRSRKRAPRAPGAESGASAAPPSAPGPASAPAPKPAAAPASKAPAKTTAPAAGQPKPRGVPSWQRFLILGMGVGAGSGLLLLGILWLIWKLVIAPA